MKNRIEHPKVFISYAWGTQEHDEKVIALATNLKGDGVEVVFDKWQLKEGNDTFKFMEKSVLDESITNVLILIDPVYAKKANERAGGVGTETQIISSEVYNKVEQRKFIPVVFERDAEGNVCKPQYLKGLLHFDLSMPDTYDTEYQRMVRTLYGIDTYKEPELGNPPVWLEETPKVSYKSRVTSDFFRGTASDAIKGRKYKENLEDLKNQIVTFEFTEEEIVDCYSELRPFRDEFLVLLKDSEFVQSGYKNIASFIEELMHDVRNHKNNYAGLKNTFVHECFIYIISYYLKSKDREAMKYIINKTYFTGHSNFNKNADSFNCFYDNNESLDNAMNKRDGKQYYCGVAALWVESINLEICNKEDFVSGDLFCHSASRLVKNYDKEWAWFPLTYVYNKDTANGQFATCAKKLISVEHLSNMAYILGFETTEELKDEFKKVEIMFHERKIEEYRYNNSFDTAMTFWHYVKAEELGIKN